MKVVQLKICIFHSASAFAMSNAQKACSGTVTADDMYAVTNASAKRFFQQVGWQDGQLLRLIDIKRAEINALNNELKNLRGLSAAMLPLFFVCFDGMGRL